MLVRLAIAIILILTCNAIEHHRCLKQITQQTCRAELEHFTDYASRHPIDPNPAHAKYYASYPHEYCCSFYKLKLCALQHVAQHCPKSSSYITQQLHKPATWRCNKGYDYETDCVVLDFVIDWHFGARVLSKIFAALLLIGLLICFHRMYSK